MRHLFKKWFDLGLDDYYKMKWMEVEMGVRKCLSEVLKSEKYSGNHQKENRSYAWD